MIGTNCQKFLNDQEMHSPRTVFFLELNLFLHETGYVIGTKFCKKLENHLGFYVPGGLCGLVVLRIITFQISILNQ